MQAEATTTELSKTHNPEFFEENVKIAQRGGKIAREARKNIEADTGKAGITSQNAAELNKVVADLIEGTVEGIDGDNKEEQKQSNR